MMLAGSRALVTGADGFIGSHLVERLIEKGACVTALSQYNSFNYWGWLEDLPALSRVHVVTGDVRDPHFCVDLTRDIDIVFHLAALIAIPYSLRAPESYVETNVKGTLNLCQGARANGVRRFIQVSTSEVYGTAQYVPIDERHPLRPQSPYSASKIAADAVALSFFYSFGLPIVIARPFNTYGPRQSARAIIPTIISQLASGCTSINLGDLSPRRDFTFVEDTCDGLASLAEYDAGVGEVFNIGSSTEISICDLFAVIAKLMNRDVTVLQDRARLRPEASEVRRLCCDNRKLRAATGFSPSTTLNQGLCRTIEWFCDTVNLGKYKSGLYNV